MLGEDINLSQMFLCTNFIIITSLHVDMYKVANSGGL